MSFSHVGNKKTRDKKYSKLKLDIYLNINFLASRLNMRARTIQRQCRLNVRLSKVSI